MAQASLTAQPGSGNDAGKLCIVSGERSVAWLPENALLFGRDLSRLSDPSHVPQLPNIRVNDNGHVDVLLRGTLWFSGSRADMARVGAHILKAARQVEELTQASRIIDDQAVIIRSGALPFALSNHPKILEEARKEAVTDTKLRQYLPSSAYCERVLVGLPTLKQYSADPLVAAKQRAAAMSPEKRRELIRELEAMHVD
jgi:hypothetical protein